MKIFLKDGTVSVQLRDIAYLADTGVLSFEKIRYNTLKEQENNMKKKEKQKKLDDNSYLSISDQLLVEYLRLEDQIVPFLNYLEMDVNRLTTQTDNAEQIYLLSKSLYAKYRYESLIDMLYTKSTKHLLASTPIEEDKDSYYQELCGFAAMATNVEDIYLLRRIKNDALLLRDEDIKNYFKTAKDSFALTMSKAQDEKVKPSQLSLLITSDDEKGHIMIKK